MDDTVTGDTPGTEQHLEVGCASARTPANVIAGEEDNFGELEVFL